MEISMTNKFKLDLGKKEERVIKSREHGLEPKNFHSIINESHLFSTTLVSLLQLSPPSSCDS